MNTWIEFLSADFSRAELIALAALFVACLSAIYARRQSAAAHAANRIAVHESLRPLRLSVYQSILDFCSFCSKYRTMLSLGAVAGTRDLVSRIDDFKQRVEMHGHLGMPEVEELARKLQAKAWLMQRALDRLAAPQGIPRTNDADQMVEERHRDELVDWFAAQRAELKGVFSPYLSTPSA